MLIGDNFIYFELQKTASSQIRKVFSKTKSLNYSIYGIHNSYYEVPPSVLGDFKNKIKIGSVRNPWDWYVSLWAWGCKKQGIYKNLAQTPRNIEGLRFFMTSPMTYLNQRKEWKKLYSDPHNKENFQLWLNKLLVEKKYAVGDGYTNNPINETSGYLTYHYLKLHTLDFNIKSRSLNSIMEIEDFDNEENFLDAVIKTEEFDNNIQTALVKLGLLEKEVAVAMSLSQGKGNPSKHADYEYYYDEQTINLVNNKEKFIIDKYGYQYN